MLASVIDTDHSVCPVTDTEQGCSLPPNLPSWHPESTLVKFSIFIVLPWAQRDAGLLAQGLCVSCMWSCW